MVKFWVHEPAYEGAGPEDSTFYLAVWEQGYLQPLNEWRQLLNVSLFNWITFDIAHIELDYDKTMMPHIGIEFVIMGLGLRLHHLTATEEERKASRAKTNEMWEEIEARSTIEDQLKELWAELPETAKALVSPDLKDRIELAVSEPEEGERKVAASSQALGTLRQTRE